MKHSTFAKSALALAFGLCATGALATTEKPVKEDFQGDAFASGINGVTTNNLTWADIEGGSEVSGGKLVVDAATTPTSATIDGTAAAGINAAVGSHNAKFNATVTFVPATEAPTISDTNSDLKFALYAMADSGATNLWVYANGGAQSTGIALTSVVDQTVEIAFTAANTFTVKVGNGSPSSSFTFKNSGSISKIEFSGNGDVDNIEFSYDANWDSLLGAPVNGAYEIDSLAELVAFQKGVADGLATASTTFKLTDDIALTEAWPGIGIQNGKDKVTGNAAQIESFDAGAFRGTFDGQNHTISGFQMVGVAGNPDSTSEGLDYCGFFNSTYGATIQNLKIQYAGGLFAVDTTANTKESGATFVGVAKNSTLQNLTTIAGTVSASKGFGGIVGYLMAGSTVDSCTNNVNLTSMTSNKAGGIAMITQGGSGDAIIRNCQNNGTTTGNNSEKGGIVGYVGVATTIENCEDTAVSIPSFLHNQGQTITLQGVNKGNATVVSYTGNATPGLNFATVDGTVATFVADNALAAGNTYKVMATGATATCVLATEGATISFNTALATPTFAITAAEGLEATSATADNIITYTAIVPASYEAEDSISVKGGSHTISATEANYLNALVEAKGTTAVETALAKVTGEELKDAALLNQDVVIDGAAAAAYTFAVTGVKKSGSNVKVDVKLTRSGTILGAIKGTVTLYSATTPNGTYTKQATVEFDPSDADKAVSQYTATFSNVSGNFFKATIE